MGMRISKRDLEVVEKRVNSRLKNIQLKVSQRYGYTAIDIKKDAEIYDTLIAGLSKREAYDILKCIERVLMLEQ